MPDHLPWHSIDDGWQAVAVNCVFIASWTPNVRFNGICEMLILFMQFSFNEYPEGVRYGIHLSGGSRIMGEIPYLLRGSLDVVGSLVSEYALVATRDDL